MADREAKRLREYAQEVLDEKLSDGLPFGQGLDKWKARAKILARGVLDHVAAPEEHCPKGDECALNKGAVHCFACGRNWPPDATWAEPLPPGVHAEWVVEEGSEHERGRRIRHGRIEVRHLVPDEKVEAL